MPEPARAGGDGDLMVVGGSDASWNRSRHAQAVLRRCAPLACFRSPVARHPDFGYLQVAHLGWRFIEPHDEFRPVFEDAVRTAPRHVDWPFKVKRNWLILPVRLTEETARCGDNFSEAECKLFADQEFCLAAPADMELILRALEAAGRTPHSGLLPGKCPKVVS